MSIARALRAPALARRQAPVAPVPAVAVRALRASLPRAAVYAIVLAMAALYAAFFSWYSLGRYDAFLMHALDMGNMDQAVWHTLHGHPFYFTNMRDTLPKEAWGTTTRLSFHVEPILLPLSLLYLIHAGPQTLIVAQAIAVALGAPAAARLALRLGGGSALLAVAAAAAYLLSPQLQAATLYEFHPVTLVAPLLLWTIVFAEERRSLPFALCAVAAICCKEEIGLVVALLCLWLWWRGGDRRLALWLGVASACWSVLALEAIVPHFARGASAYWQRYIDAGSGGARTSSGATGLLRYWFQHPEKPILTLLWAPKLAYLNRLLASAGYLGVLGLPLLLVSLPSLAVILLSTDQHMYGGVGHYSAELVPFGVAAALYGVAWLRALATRRGLSARYLVAGCALWLLLLAMANCRANGFTPLSEDYAAPALSAHAQLGQRLLRLIPPGAPVSAQDQLDPHLGDRPITYLFPDVGDARAGYAQYVALDVTSNANPGTADDPGQLTVPLDQQRAAMRLLASRRYRILAAEDGYLILQRMAQPLAAAPTLPAGFFSFMLPGPSAGRPLARFGQTLELLGVQTLRREQVNLRTPDVILVATFRVLRPLPRDLRLHVVLTDTHGRQKNDFTDHADLDWLPPDRWSVGGIVRFMSQQISIVEIAPGSVDLQLHFSRGRVGGQDPAFQPRLMVHESAPSIVVLGDGLRVARLPVVL